jgi:hypothetical protein
MPLTLIALSKVDDKDACPASSLVNTGHLVGRSIVWVPNGIGGLTCGFACGSGPGTGSIAGP